MLYLTYEPYNDDIYDNAVVECFICFEYLCEDCKPPIQLYNRYYYFKNCNCHAIVHDVCLDTWYNIHHNCPICRIPFFKNSILYNLTHQPRQYFTYKMKTIIYKFMYYYYFLIVIIDFYKYLFLSYFAYKVYNQISPHI